MMKKRKKVVAVVLTVIMVLGLTACGNSSNSGDVSGNNDASGDSDREITVWIEKIFSDEANAKMQERLEQYGEENGVEVTVELIGATDFITKLNAAIEAGENVPDIISSSTTKVLNYYPNIPCKDVTDLVNSINEERPYLSACTEGTEIDGKYYYVPFHSSTNLMYVRKDKLAEAGITEMPTTWDEVFEVAEAVSDPDNDFYGLAWGCGENDDDDENTLRQYMWNEGAYLFDTEGNFIGDEGVEAVFNKYAELYNNGVIPPDATTWDAGGNNSSYLAGRTAICFNAPTLYNAMASDEQYADLLENTEVLTPPAGSDNDVYMNFYVGFSIMNTCSDDALAEDVISYLLDKEWYDSYFDEVAPVLAPVFEDAKETDTWSSGVNAVAIEYVEHATGYYGYPVESLKGRTVAAKHYFTYPFVKAVNQVATGTADAKGALDSMKSAIEDFQDQVSD